MKTLVLLVTLAIISAGTCDDSTCMQWAIRRLVSSDEAACANFTARAPSSDLSSEAIRYLQSENLELRAITGKLQDTLWNVTQEMKRELSTLRTEFESFRSTATQDVTENSARISALENKTGILERWQVNISTPAFSLRSMDLSYDYTSEPNFTRVHPGEQDRCTMELLDGYSYDCNWWNVWGPDGTDFVEMERHDCIGRGVQTNDSATWFLNVMSYSENDETRALLISPIIERKRTDLLLTLWHAIKCDGTRIRIHLVPADLFLGKIIRTTNVVAEIKATASNSTWEYASRQIHLPETHDSYHIILEAVLPSSGSCENYSCTAQGSTVDKPYYPTLGIDEITLQLMRNECNNSGGSNVLDCTFQTPSGQSTTCDWESSNAMGDEAWAMPGWEDYFSDWRPENSGMSSSEDHGAQRHHFDGRGYIMTFDATGRTGSTAHIRTPLMIAKDTCTCVMSFLYLMRGIFAPTMQVNMVYGSDINNNNNRTVKTQWSLTGNQSDHWQLAMIPIDLQEYQLFQIEIRVTDIIDSRGDIHFDDVEFKQCDMERI